MLHSVHWQLFINVSRQPIRSIFNGQAVQEELFSDAWHLKMFSGCHRHHKCNISIKS